MDSTDKIRNLCFTMAEQLEGARGDLIQHLGGLTETMEGFLALGKSLKGSEARRGADAPATAFPPGLLRAPDTSGLAGVAEIVVSAMLERWNESLHRFFDDPDRIYVPRETKKLVRRLREKKIGAVMPEDIEKAATIAFQKYLVKQSQTFRVKRSPQGDENFTYRPHAGNLLLTFIVRLLEDDGAFDGMEQRMRELYEQQQSPSLAAAAAEDAPSASETAEYRAFLRACGLDDEDGRWWPAASTGN